MFLKITKGAHSSPLPPPTEFQKFDTKRAQIDRMKAQFIALRDKALAQERNQSKAI